MPTVAQAVPELRLAQKLMKAKLATRALDQNQTQFVYHTLRQLERLLALPDLSRAEALILKENLTGLLEKGNADDYTAMVRNVRVIGKVTGANAPPLRAGLGAGRRKPRVSYGTMGPPPGNESKARERPPRASSTEPTCSGRSTLGRRGGSTSGAHKSGNSSMFETQASAPASPPKKASAPSWDDGPQAPVEVELDEWTAITIYADEKFKKDEAAKLGIKPGKQAAMRADLDAHVQMKEQQKLKEKQEIVDYVRDQDRRLAEWKASEAKKAAVKAGKVAEEKKLKAEIRVLTAARLKREKEEELARDRTFLAEIQRQIQEEKNQIKEKNRLGALKQKAFEKELEAGLVIKAARKQKETDEDLKLNAELKARMDKAETDRAEGLAKVAERQRKLAKIAASENGAIGQKVEKDKKLDAQIEYYAQKADHEADIAEQKKQAKIKSQRIMMKEAIDLQMTARERERAELRETEMKYARGIEREHAAAEAKDKAKVAGHKRLMEANARDLEKQIAATDAMYGERKNINEGLDVFKIANMDQRERRFNKKLLGTATETLDAGPLQVAGHVVKYSIGSPLKAGQ